MSDPLPNGWPQPTFMSIAEDGALHIEWCLEGRRVAFIWDPDLESAQVLQSTHTEHDSICTDDGDDPHDITAMLDQWLRTDSAKGGA